MSDFSTSETDKGGVLGHFFWQSVPNPDAAKLEGVARFKQVPYVRIVTPNAKWSMPEAPVNDEHKARWPRAWAQFEAGNPGLADGETPIEEFPVLQRYQVDHMRSVKIISVNQLANVSDGNLDMVVTRELRERAKQFLQGASETEQQLRRDLADTQKQLKDALIRLNQLEAALAVKEAEKSDQADEPAAKRGPGRPRKAA